jgi:putative RNA 2'-phosphotransferase
MDAKISKTISKLLSFVLRHHPELIGLKLDEKGWANVDLLLLQLNAHDKPIDRKLLEYVVETNNKKRFAFNEDKTLIRASQGHSIAIELGLTAQTPPDILFHGTAEKFVASILDTGLEKRGRQHVHLSQDLQTAIQVGGRHGKPVIFKVFAAEMKSAGYLFYLSENQVWLTDHVPVRFISYPSNDGDIAPGYLKTI